MWSVLVKSGIRNKDAINQEKTKSGGNLISNLGNRVKARVKGYLTNIIFSFFASVPVSQQEDFKQSRSHVEDWRINQCLGES